MKILEHDIIKVNIDDIVFDKTNPNTMNDKQMHALRQSMEKFGYLVPVVLDQNNTVADGEHRALVYKEMGIKEIPCYKLQLESDTERRMLRQVMNKLHGEHQKDLDADELATIFENEKLPELAEIMAQEQDDLKRLIQRYHPEVAFAKPEEFQEINEKDLKKMVPDTQLGDIYQLGKHRLVCGDCSDKRSIDRLLEDAKVDMLLTDPPYGVNYADKNEFLNTIGKGNRIETPIENDSIKDYRQFFGSFLAPIPFQDYNTCYIFMSNKEIHNLRLAIEDNDIQWGDYLIWVKNNHVVNYRKDYNSKHEIILYGWKGKHKFYGEFSTTVLEYDKPQSSELHSVMKPIPLLAKLIRDGSQEGMNIYDPFCGSGSTLLACEQTNRLCYAMEIDPHYCDVIVDRWEKYTGNKAERIQSS